MATERQDFIARVKALLAVMVPLLLALLAYLKATGANDDAAHDEKIKQLMFSSLPTKAEVQARWVQMDEREKDVFDRLKRLEEYEREHDKEIAKLQGEIEKASSR